MRAPRLKIALPVGGRIELERRDVRHTWGSEAPAMGQRRRRTLAAAWLTNGLGRAATGPQSVISGSLWASAEQRNRSSKPELSTAGNCARQSVASVNLC